MNFHDFFHNISFNRKLYFDDLIEKANLNMMEIEILVYIYRYPDNNTFTEIQRLKNYSKSHISTSISHLIQKDYLARENSLTNKKVYNLRLLEKSEPVIHEYFRCVTAFQKDAFKDINDNELEHFKEILLKISNNLQER
ncbi:MAG: MarR family winged helix-turn-helix transcriptional regulator [bacterium]